MTAANLPAPQIVNLDSMTCGVCGLIFAVPDYWIKKRKTTGKGFCCPNGCNIAFKENHAEKLERQLAAERQRKEVALRRANESIAREKATQRSNAALRGVATKLKKKTKRIAAGVCPCCNRTFKQLAAHMKEKHPHYKGDH